MKPSKFRSIHFSNKYCNIFCIRSAESCCHVVVKEESWMCCQLFLTFEIKPSWKLWGHSGTVTTTAELQYHTDLLQGKITVRHNECLCQVAIFIRIKRYSVSIFNSEAKDYNFPKQNESKFVYAHLPWMCYFHALQRNNYHLCFLHIFLHSQYFQ